MAPKVTCAPILRWSPSALLVAVWPGHVYIEVTWHCWSWPGQSLEPNYTKFRRRTCVQSCDQVSTHQVCASENFQCVLLKPRLVSIQAPPNLEYKVVGSLVFILPIFHLAKFAAWNVRSIDVVMEEKVACDLEDICTSQPCICVEYKK